MPDARWWPAATEIADEIRRALDADDPAHAIRMLADGVGKLPGAHEAGRLDEALESPPSIGDPRWDALLAGAIRYQLHHMGLSTPAWTLKEPLTKAWWPFFVNDGRALYDMATAPAELSRLGIFLSEKDLRTA